MHYKNYESALNECSKVACEEFKESIKALKEVRQLTKDISAEVSRIVENTKQDGMVIADAHQQLSELQKTLDHTISSSIRSTREALHQKKHSLTHFTVTLFGRTQAGKSTIREALTGGDGSTIGKGAQRTTRDVHEYEWNFLRIVDTPGIGAYEGAEDRKLALSVVDRSDIMLFIASSDSIQEESFRGMQALRSQNKPVIFVLNVKKDLKTSVVLRRFLKDSSTVFGEQEITGHFNRIRTLAGKFLGMRDIRIVPIHAQAAFLATQPEYAKNSAQLHEYSRIGCLLAELTDEVQYKGRVRRLQTILDGTLNALVNLQNQFHEQANIIEKRATYLKDKFGELDIRLKRFVPETHSRIESEATQLIKPLRISVSKFVDENIEKPDVAKIWKKKVEAINISQWLKKQQELIISDVKSLLEEFIREMNIEQTLNADFKIKDPKTYDPWDVKRTLNWISAGGSALAGVAAIGVLVFQANFWNPVGWAAGVIGIGAWMSSWFFNNREENLRQGKKKATDQLREQIDKIEQEISENLKAWFTAQIEKRLFGSIQYDTTKLCDGMFDIARALDKGSRQVGDIVDRLNQRLLIRAGKFMNIQFDDQKIKRVARSPGVRSKLLWADGINFFPFNEIVSEVIGECLDGVPDGPPQVQVAASLSPATVHHHSVLIRGNYVEVQLSLLEAERAIGKKDFNVLLANQLLQLNIKIIAQEK